MKEIVLYFGDDSALAPIRRAMRVRGVALRAVAPQDCGKTLGELAAAKERPAGEGGGTGEPMLVFCGFSASRLDLALNGLRREGLSVALKAVLTASNRAWTPQTLRAELLRERAALTSR